VCASNLPLWEGREWFAYPVAPGEPGHEAWGVVDAVGPGVRGLPTGSRVATLAANGFAEYAVVDSQNAAMLPEPLHNCDFPGEALGCTLNIFSRSAIYPGAFVAIVGIGFLGAALTQLCVRAGARVTAISRSEYSLRLARLCGAHGAVAMTNPRAAIEAAQQAAGNNLFERVIETAGVQDTLDIATELTAEGGRLVIAGYHQDGGRQVDMRLWNWRGIDVINAHERKTEIRLAGIRAAIGAVLAGRLRLDRLGMRRFALHRINEAFDSIRGSHSSFAKAVVRMSSW
jgi:threonine dehydrogenase-like Zn-dependent dehydrogenase